MVDEKINNPFAQAKKTNWAKKAQEKYKPEVGKKIVKVESKKNIKRVTKSFKVYPNNLGRDFDKRVNKLQVIFDDLNYDKEFVDSGKYLMFLMAFAEKYKLYELYNEVFENGDLLVDSKKLKEFGKKLS